MAQTSFYVDNANRSYPLVHPAVAQGYADQYLVSAGFVAGARANYVHTTSEIRLQHLFRLENSLEVVVRMYNLGALAGESKFQVDLSKGDYVTTYSDTPVEGAEHLLSGFIVTGRQEEMLKLPNNSVVSPANFVFEPALTVNRSGTVVTSIRVANEDRTRVSESNDNAGNRDIIEITGDLRGDLKLVDGYNTEIRYNVVQGQIVFRVLQGAGAGNSCSDIPVFPGETLSSDSSPEGVLRCEDVLRSFNGVGGQRFDFLGQADSQVRVIDDENRIVIDLEPESLRQCLINGDSEIITTEFEDLSEFENE